MIGEEEGFDVNTMSSKKSNPREERGRTKESRTREIEDDRTLLMAGQSGDGQIHEAERSQGISVIAQAKELTANHRKLRLKGR